VRLAVDLWLNFFSELLLQVLEIKRDEKKIFVTQYVGTTVHPKALEKEKINIVAFVLKV